MASTLIVTIQENGDVRTDASKMIGEESELLAALNELASDLGGELTVEKHKPGIHHHHHGGHGHSHSHGGHGHSHD